MQQGVLVWILKKNKDIRGKSGEMKNKQLQFN